MTSRRVGSTLAENGDGRTTAVEGAAPPPTRQPGPGAEGTSARRAGPLRGELRRMLAAGELDLPLPGAGRTAQRWAALAAWGARDLSLARLAEGHVDALAILTEAGRAP